MTNRRSLSLRYALLALMLACLAVTAAEAAPTLTVKPTAGHPDNTVQVSGRGFAANEVLDIYFAKTDELLVRTDASGNFGAHALPIPADATPGKHWITAVGRRTGDTARVLFTVRTGWTQRGFNADGQRHNPYENVLNVSNISGLDVAWTVPIGGLGSPAIAGATSMALYATSKRGMYAFDAGTGTQLWFGCWGNRRDVTPAVANGVVYVGGESRTFACNAATGKYLWSAIGVGTLNATSPSVADGTVYVSSASKLYALNSATGAVLWTAATRNDIFSSPVVANGVVYVGDILQDVYAYNAATGALLWTTTLDGNSGRLFMSVANGVVYVASIYKRVYALDVGTGAVLWMASTSGNIYSSPAVADGVVYFGSDDGKVYALSAANGAALWTAIIGGKVRSSPAVAKGVVYVGSNNIYALNAATGSVLWSAATPVGSAPAVVNGMLYVTTNTSVDAYALKAGAGVRDGPPPTPPAAASLRPDYHLQIAW